MEKGTQNMDTNDYGIPSINAQIPGTESTQLIEREPLGTSALDMVGNPEKGYAVVMGKKRITAWFKTMQELKNYIKHDKWHFIIQLFGTIYEYMEEMKERPNQPSYDKVIGDGGPENK